MIWLLLLAAQSQSSTELSSASDAANNCVMTQSARLEGAKEAADITVDAAITACMSEFVTFRIETTEFLDDTSPTLAENRKKDVAQTSFEQSRNAIRNRAILSVVEKRTKNAPNN